MSDASQHSRYCLDVFLLDQWAFKKFKICALFKNASKMSVYVQCADGDPVAIPDDVLGEFSTLRDMAEDVSSGKAEDITVPVSTVKRASLVGVIACYNGQAVDESHVRATYPKPGNATELLTTANYIGANKLVDVLVSYVADGLKHVDADKIPEYFGVESNFTPEEEAAAIQAFPWLKKP